ncbi:MAG: DcaP family trimeric outer membrane transporter, partial [Alistipes sp.]
MVALLFVSTASAQRTTNKRAHENYAPTVTMISVNETEVVDTCCCPIMAALAQNRLATAAALDDYRITHRPGFSQSEKPQYIFTNKSNRFSFAIGGYINLRAAYDMNGIVDNIDFVPSAIPMQSNYATQEQLMMDATTSRFYLKAITHSRTLGRVVIYVETDFRGGNRGSYTPRLRMAYVSFKGFTFGRDVTTFCDLAAGPNTIDFQGPNGY